MYFWALLRASHRVPPIHTLIPSIYYIDTGDHIHRSTTDYTILFSKTEDLVCLFVDVISAFGEGFKAKRSQGVD